MFKKILIANRGEVAVRIIRACKEWGISTVAIHSDVDKESMHVKLADESLCVGSHQPSDSYLNIPSILSAIEVTNSDAVHPGYGFLSENYNFAKILKDNNIKFVGPSPDVIKKMGDKIEAKKNCKKIWFTCDRRIRRRCLKFRRWKKNSKRNWFSYTYKSSRWRRRKRNENSKV